MYIIDLLLNVTGDVQMAILPVLAIGGLLAAGAGAVGSSVTRNKQKKALRNMQAGIDAEQRENTNWYNANALTDYTQRADAQNLFKNLRDNLRRNRDVTKSTAAVTGATTASIAKAKEQDSKAISDTYSNVAAMGQRYKDNVTDQYLRRKDYLRNQGLGLAQQDYQSYDRVASGWHNFMNSGLNTAKGAVMSNYASMIPSGGVNMGRRPGEYGMYYNG